MFFKPEIACRLIRYGRYHPDPGVRQVERKPQTGPWATWTAF